MGEMFLLSGCSSAFELWCEISTYHVQSLNIMGAAGRRFDCSASSANFFPSIMLRRHLILERAGALKARRKATSVCWRPEFKRATLSFSSCRLLFFHAIIFLCVFSNNAELTRETLFLYQSSSSSV